MEIGYRCLTKVTYNDDDDDDDDEYSNNNDMCFIFNLNVLHGSRTCTCNNTYFATTLFLTFVGVKGALSSA